MPAKRSDPWIPVGHPDFKWTPHADVQKLWRKYGWVPPSETRPPVEVENKEPAWVAMQRAK